MRTGPVPNVFWESSGADSTGVVGAERGSRVSTRLMGEQLRALLGLLILLVGLKMFIDLTLPPDDIFHVVPYLD